MYLGLDIGGTNIKAAVVQNDGTILRQYSQPTEAARGRDAMLADIRTLVETILHATPHIRAVGVGVPGVVNPADGCVYHPPNLPGWEVVPLTELIHAYCPVPVAVDNDANTAALAEAELGAGRGRPFFLYVTLGTGVGGGIIAGNRLFRGERGGAGEVGHMVIDAQAQPDGRPSFRTGTLEELIGRQGILRIAAECAHRHPDSLLHGYAQPDVEDISRAAAAGDTAAQECFRRTGAFLGLGLVSVLTLLDMRYVVVGGGISQAHPLLLDTAQQTLRQRALPTIAQEATIVRAHFGNDAGVVGAAMLAKLAVE